MGQRDLNQVNSEDKIITRWFKIKSFRLLKSEAHNKKTLHKAEGFRVPQEIARLLLKIEYQADLWFYPILGNIISQRISILVSIGIGALVER